MANDKNLAVVSHHRWLSCACDLAYRGFRGGGHDRDIGIPTSGVTAISTGRSCLFIQKPRVKIGPGRVDV